MSLNVNVTSSSVPQGPVSQNIDALLYELDAMHSVETNQSTQASRNLIKSYIQRAQKLRDEKIKRMEKSFRAHGNKNILKAKIKEINVRQALEKVLKNLRSQMSFLNQTVRTHGQHQDRIMDILRDLDEGKDKINQTSEDKANNSQLSMGNSSTCDALAAGIHSQYGMEKVNRMRSDQQYHRVFNSLARHKNALQKKLDTIKKQGFFSKFFKILTSVIMPIVQLATAALFPPLSAALTLVQTALQQMLRQMIQMLVQMMAQMALQLSQAAVMKPLQDQMESAQKTEVYESQHSQDLLKRISENQKAIQEQKSLQIQTQQNLEQVLFSA